MRSEVRGAALRKSTAVRRPCGARSGRGMDSLSLHQVSRRGRFWKRWLIGQKAEAVAMLIEHLEYVKNNGVTT